MLMDTVTLEYYVTVMQNLLFTGQRQVQAGNGAHALYFIENEVLPMAKAFRDTFRRELGWSELE